MQTCRAPPRAPGAESGVSRWGHQAPSRRCACRQTRLPRLAGSARVASSHVPALPGSSHTRTSSPGPPARPLAQPPHPAALTAGPSPSTWTPLSLFLSHLVPSSGKVLATLLHSELALRTLAVVSRLQEEPRSPAASVSVSLTLCTATRGFYTAILLRG